MFTKLICSYCHRVRTTLPERPISVPVVNRCPRLTAGHLRLSGDTQPVTSSSRCNPPRSASNESPLVSQHVAVGKGSLSKSGGSPFTSKWCQGRRTCEESSWDSAISRTGTILIIEGNNSQLERPRFHILIIYKVILNACINMQMIENINLHSTKCKIPDYFVDVLEYLYSIN